MKQYAAGQLPVRSILRRFPDLIQGTVDASVDSGVSHPVVKAEDPKFVQAVVQLVRERDVMRSAVWPCVTTLSCHCLRRKPFAGVAHTSSAAASDGCT
jgi:hypothetical protein